MSIYTDGSIEPAVNTESLDKADALMSIAISLKRIADLLEEITKIEEDGE